MTPTLLKKIKFTGNIVLKTGLHIGGTNSALNIGGPDKFVVRNPLTNLPYIPGSSLKGKMRALIELMDGTINKKGEIWGPSQSLNDRSARLFGTVGNEQRPSRLIVRDCCLTSDDELFSNTDLPYTESKTEVNICRITSAANPRTFERVPAGAEFKLEMVLNVFSTDEESDLKETLKSALAMLQDDYLGGNGSRGYGQIEIKDLKEEAKDVNSYK